MYDKSVALKIVEQVNKEGICLIEEQSNLIARWNSLKYYYSNEEMKAKHEKIMLSQGYEVMDKKRERLYSDLYTGDKVGILAGVYIKYGYYKPFLN